MTAFVGVKWLATLLIWRLDPFAASWPRNVWVVPLARDLVVANLMILANAAASLSLASCGAALPRANSRSALRCVRACSRLALFGFGLELAKCWIILANYGISCVTRFCPSNPNKAAFSASFINPRQVRLRDLLVNHVSGERAPGRVLTCEHLA